MSAVGLPLLNPMNVAVSIYTTTLFWIRIFPTSQTRQALCLSFAREKLGRAVGLWEHCHLE